MIVFDTNVISELIKSEPDPRVIAWSAGLTHPVFITTTAIAEMRLGVAQLPDGKRKDTLRRRVEETIERYRSLGRILAYDEPSTVQFAKIVIAQRDAGRPIEVEDAQIAAICAAHGCILATRNVKDFTATGLTVVNPWAE